MQVIIIGDLHSPETSDLLAYDSLWLSDLSKTGFFLVFHLFEPAVPCLALLDRSNRVGMK